MNTKQLRRKKIKYGIRKKIRGTALRPRLCIFRSNKTISCQIIDDIAGVTLATASSKNLKMDGSKTDLSKEVGKAIADQAKSQNIEEVVFDRSGYLYHGRVKSLAEGARENGLKF